MKTLKFSSYVLVLIIGLSTILSSCKKDKVYPIEGNWVGTYNNGTDYYMAFTIKNGGTLDVMDNPANKSQITASGTWTLTSGQFDTVLDYGTGTNTSFTSPFNGKSDKLTGTWGTTPSTTDGGTWTMTK
jgi:hypothetical protein